MGPQFQNLHDVRMIIIVALWLPCSANISRVQVRGNQMDHPAIYFSFNLFSNLPYEDE